MYVLGQMKLIKLFPIKLIFLVLVTEYLILQMLLQMSKRNFLYLFALLQIIRFASSSAFFPFTTVSYVLAFTTPNPSTPQTTDITFTRGLSASYQGSLSLTGFQLNIGSALKFKMYLEPNITLTSASVTVILYPTTQILQITGQILFVDTSQSFIWMENYTSVFSTVSIASGSLTVQNYQVLLPSPSGGIADFAFISPISWIDTYSQGGADIGMMRNTALAAPNLLDITISCTNQAVNKMGFVIVVYNSSYFDLFEYPVANIFIDINTTVAITDIGLNMPYYYKVAGDMYAYYCGIGISSFNFRGNEAFFFYPNINVFPVVTSLTATSLEVMQAALCIKSSCGNYSYYDGSQCYACLANCLTCQNGTVCISCIQPYFLNQNGTECLQCGDYMTNCDTCNNQTFCTRCLAGLNLVLTPDHNCSLCTDAYPHCLICFNELCTQCQTGYGIQLSNNTCALCSASIPFCDTCLNTASCQTCINNSYALSSTNLCALCQTFMSNCATCLTNTQCLHCFNTSITSYVLTSNFQCQECSIALPGCFICSNISYCLTCLPQLIMNSNHLGCHPCYVGWYVAGICTSIIGCIQPFVYADGTGGCLACNTTLYNPVPVNNACECISGWRVNGGCTTIYNCILVVYASNGSSICKACDVTSRSILFQSTCICKQHFELMDGDCVDICGDGYLEDAGQGKCDDGNAENGDGCSSSCQVEVGYRCQNGSSTHSSQCTYVGVPLKISVKSIKRYKSENRGIFSFKVSPPLSIIGKVNLFQNVNLTCQASYQIFEISYSSGDLVITVDYNTDMEGETCSLNLSFNSSFISRSIDPLYFLAYSSTLPLIISENSAETSIANFIFQILAYSGLAVFFASLPHKMIGAQLLTCYQSVYYSILLYNPFKTPFDSLQNLETAKGYYPIFAERDNQNIFPFSGWIEANHHFVNNIGIVLIILVIIVAILIGLIVFEKLLPHEVPEQNTFSGQGNTVALTKLSKVITILYDWCLFPVALGFAPSILISIFLGNLNVTDPSQTNNLYDSLGELFCIGIIGSISLIQLLYCIAAFCRLNIGGLKEANKIYIPLFIIRSLLLSFLFQMGLFLSFGQIYYCILFLESIFFIFVLIFRPYVKTIDNIGIIFCQFSSVIAVFTPLLVSKVNMGQQLLIIVVLLIEGLLFLSLIFSFTRIIVVYKNCAVELCRKDKSDEQKFSGSQRNNSCKKKLIQNNQIDRQLRQNFMRNASHFVEGFNKTLRPIYSKITEERKKNVKFSRYKPFQLPSKILKEQKNEVIQDQQMEIIKNKLRQNLKLKKEKDRKGRK